MVSLQLYYTISSEELFVFLATKKAVFMRLAAFRKRLTNEEIEGRCVFERKIMLHQKDD